MFGACFAINVVRALPNIPSTNRSQCVRSNKGFVCALLFKKGHADSLQQLHGSQRSCCGANKTTTRDHTTQESHCHQPPVAVVAQLVAEAAAEAEAAAVPVEHQGDWTLEPLLLGERSIAGLQRRQCSC